MKMANMDSAFDFMFTNPKDDKGVSIQSSNFNVCDYIIILSRSLGHVQEIKEIMLFWTCLIVGMNQV